MKQKFNMIFVLYVLILLFFGCNLNKSETTDNVATKSSDDGHYKHVIMIYVDGDNNLESAALEDINEMEDANLDPAEVKIIVIVDRIPGEDSSDGNWTGTRLYEIVEDNDLSKINSNRISGMGLTSTGDYEELNMGDKETLSNFVDFVKTSYNGELYSLIMWNHGGGWRNINSSRTTDSSMGDNSRAICWDDTSGEYEALYMADVSSVLDNEDLAVIGFDACLMGMLEVGYELKNSGNIMVASEQNEPGDGWNYKAVLSSFITSDKSGSDLADSIINEYEKTYNGYYTLSSVDLTVVDYVISKLNIFSNSLLSKNVNDIFEARYYSNQYNDSDFYDYYAYIDLYEFVKGCSSFSIVESKDLIEALDLYILKNVAGGDDTGSMGVSIYFPLFSSHFEFIDYTEDNISFLEVCKWDAFLSSLLNN